MHIPRLFCVTDQIEMLISQTGALYEVFNSTGSYYKVYADTYYCPDCCVKTAVPSRSAAYTPRTEGYDSIKAADTLILNN